MLGGSWGVTLALAYAQQHPSRVSGMVLRGVCLFREREIGWLFAPGVGASILNPRGYADFTSTLSEEEVAGGLQGVLGAYARDLMGEDTAARVGLPTSQSLFPTPLICCWSEISHKTLYPGLNPQLYQPHATRDTPHATT